MKPKAVVDSVDSTMTQKKDESKKGFITKVKAWFEYMAGGVWNDTSTKTRVKVAKVVNLSFRSFMDRDLQTKSMALTFSTVLAIVPAFAMLFAIGRGFGFQNLLEEQLFMNFPAQKSFITFALKFVDSYLTEASQGVFVGVGLIFLLYTMVSLLSDIETSFNQIWDIKRDRSIYQKITDYIAICLLVPVMMICASGVSIFMSSTLQSNTHFAFLTPLVNVGLEASPFILAFLAFSISLCLIPHTRVKFKYAATAGAICAIIFQILQMLFLSGQLYVSKYNAIYGSFSFLPLLLIWLQLSWLILLFGCVLTYSMQNVFAFNFLDNSVPPSRSLETKVMLIIMAVVSKRFHAEEDTLSIQEISIMYNLPIRMVNRLCEKLKKAGLVNMVMKDEYNMGVAPAVDTDELTVGNIFKKIENEGNANFIPRFNVIYAKTIRCLDEWFATCYKDLDKIPLKEIPLPENTNSEEIIVAKSD
ncbi:MAG: YihY family inner membrane protein [Muribaculaceae bacterium]|nr:YihY family inner membrane protein [Muribaculaceae bacterium]